MARLFAPTLVSSEVGSRRQFGSVRRLPSGRWQARYEHGGQRYPSPVTFARKGDALAWLAEVETSIRRGAWADPEAGKVTFGEWATRWLTTRMDLRPSTRRLYEDLLRLHIEPAFGSIPLARLTVDEIVAWHGNLFGRQPATAAKAYRLLSEILRRAVDDGLLARSPARVPGAGTERPPERPTITPEDLEDLIAAMPERMQVVPVLACWCSLRRAEILGLQRCDMDLERAEIHVERTRQVLPGGAVVGPPKTEAGVRHVAVPPPVVPRLASHMERFVPLEPRAWIVTGDKGGPLRPHSLQMAWDRARRAIGRPELHLHDLRHSGLTMAAAVGATTAELMHRGGHASPAAALRYQHASRERDQAIARAMAKLAVTCPTTEQSSGTDRARQAEHSSVEHPPDPA